MTTIDTSQTQAPLNYLNVRTGFLAWALTLDHKRIGIMYLISVLSAFFFGGLAALALRRRLPHRAEAQHVLREATGHGSAGVDHWRGRRG